MRTGVARLVSAPGARVQGLIVPNQQEGAADKPPGDQPQPPGPAGARAPGSGEDRPDELEHASAQRTLHAPMLKSAPRRGRPGRLRPRQALPQAAGGAERLDQPEARRGGRPARPQRRRQDHDLLHDHRPGAARRGRGDAGRRTTSPTLPMYRRARLGLGYLPQEASIFRGLSVEDNIRAGARGGRARARPARADAGRAAGRVRHRPSAPRPGAGAVGRRAAALRDRPRAGDAALATSCSTSRWPASTRSRSARSATWSST